jgi:hypothetical protein
MDEMTLSDIRQRIARWQKDWTAKGKPAADKEMERAWSFAVNIDDVELMLAEIERLQQENHELQEMLNDEAMDAAVDASEAMALGKAIMEAGGLDAYIHAGFRDKEDDGTDD